MAERERRPRREQAAQKTSPGRPGRSAGGGASIAHRIQLERAVRLIDRICQVAGDPSFIDKARRRLARCGVRKAIRQHESPVLFEWLAEQFSYRGIANEVAFDYMDATAGSAHVRLHARSMPARPALSSRATGILTAAVTVRAPRPVRNPRISGAVPCPRTICAMAA